MFRKVLTLSAVLALASGIGQAALWQGGSADWASDAWNEELDGGWPGDANHPTTPAEINAGGEEISIGEKDSILLEHPAGAIIKAGEVIQTGGTFTSNSRLDVRDTYRLRGGTLEGKGSLRISQGGLLQIDGGRLEAPTSEILFQAGQGALRISDGEVNIGHVIMNKNPSSEAVVEVVGSKARLTALTFRLGGGGGQSTARFVFDASGISGWTVQGGPASLALGPEDNPGNLVVDVTACQSDGSEVFVLFDYTIPSALAGSFGDISVSHGTTQLTPTAATTPGPGQYLLSMEDGEIDLQFNNQGLPPTKK